MALIVCKECGKKYSDNASSCPECGNPTIKNDNVNSNESGSGYTQLEVNKQPKGKMPIIIVVIVLIIIIGAIVLPKNSSIFNSESNSFEVDDESDNLNVEDNKKINKVSITKNTTKVKGEYGSNALEAEISVDKVYVTNKVEPESPKQSYYRYYEAEKDKKYLVVVLNVKNTGNESLDTDRVFTNFLGDTCSMKATLDGKYKYNGFVVGLEKDNRGKYDLDAYYYLDALETTKIYGLFEIAEEVSDKSVSVNLCFGETVLNIDYSK